MKKLTLRQKKQKRGLAQLLVAEARMTDREIAKFLKISTSTLSKWKAEASFKTMVKQLEAQLAVLRARTYRCPIMPDQIEGGAPLSKS
jgi:transcriptional regulator with XRE-family HTH domain